MMPPEAAYFNYRDPQTLWGMLEEIAMYQRRFPLPRHPCARTSAPTCTGVGEHARVRPCTAAKKEGGSFVRGTEESDRAAPLAPAEVEIREGAVLRGSGGPEHQAASAVPEPTDTAGSASHHIAQSREEQVDEDILAAKKPFCWRTFSTPTPVFVNYEKSI